MDKQERRERARAALACLELAARAVTQAGTESAGLVPDKDANKCHAAIGKLQLRLTRWLDK